MKKITITLSIIFALSVFSLSDLQAQNNTTDSEDVKFDNISQLITNVNQGLRSAEERKINVVVEDHKPE